MSDDDLTKEEASERARLLSNLEYEVDLDLTGDDETFVSEAVLRFDCAEPGIDTFCDLRAVSLERATLNGAPLPPSAFEGSRLALPRLAARNELRVRAHCAYERTGVGLHHFRDPVDGAVYLHTQFEPFDHHRVFASFDQPDLKGRFAVSVSAPQGWEVVSNGHELTRSPSGKGAERFRFATTLPMSTYLVAVVAGPYRSIRSRHRDIDLGIYCRASLEEYLDAEEIFSITADGLDFFETAFDYPYPFGKYDQLFVPEFSFGAMENVACITFSERYLFRSRVTQAERESRAETILHEMAHMWFGDLVTMKWWDDLWLNESFATYISHLAAVSATRFKDAWVSFANGLKNWAYRQDQLPTTHPIVADVPSAAAALVNFDGITYAKGASVLRQLVAWVGEDRFLAGCQSYFKRHEFGNATLDDFLGALEEASGRNLREWSAHWLETAGVNTLRASVTTALAAEGEVFTGFEVLQEAPAEWPTLRPHRLGIGFYDNTDGRLVRREGIGTGTGNGEDDGGGDGTMLIDVTGAVSPAEELVGRRVPALLLLNDGDLAYSKVRLDPTSLEALSEGLSRLDDRLARSLCWSALWDMLRDGELSAGRYLDIVLAHAGAEPISVVTSLLGQASGAALVFGHPSNRERALARLFEVAEAETVQAEAGSDLQLAWARTWIGAARSPAGLARVQSLLEEGGPEGQSAVPGLAVDTELRWHVVQFLAAAGTIDEGVIKEEEDRDPTDAGARHADSARAARPTAEAKAAAWELLVNQADLSLARVRAIMRGFSRPDQDGLLQEYAPAFFEVLDRLWEERGQDVALDFAEDAFPPPSEETVSLAEAWLASPDRPPSLRRMVLEGADQARRVLLTRAADGPG
ncbi:MAG: aminopeptidase N [Acidimicrobiia bacterium]